MPPTRDVKFGWEIFHGRGFSALRHVASAPERTIAGPQIPEVTALPPKGGKAPTPSDTNPASKTFAGLTLSDMRRPHAFRTSYVLSPYFPRAFPRGLSKQIKARKRPWEPSHPIQGLCCGLPGVDENLPKGRVIPGDP